MTAELEVTFEEPAEGPGGCLLCRYTGPFNTPHLLSAVRDVTRFCTERGYGRVVMDLRSSEGDLTVEDRYLLANSIRYQAPTSLRVAICIREDQGDTHRTWTTVMSGHGFVACAFHDLPSAIEWLVGRPTWRASVGPDGGAMK